MATNLFNELARYYGGGQQRRILEDEKVAAQIRGFEALTPVRAIQREEEEGVVRGREQRATGRDIAKEQRARAQEMEDRGMIHELLAPTLEREIPPTITEKGVSPEATAEILRERPATVVTPFRVPTGAPLPAYKELYDLLEKQRTGRSRGMNEIELAMGMATQKHGRPPTPEEIADELVGIRGRSTGARVGAGIDVRLDKPPIANEQTREEIANQEALLEQGERAAASFRTEFAGILGGRVRGRAMARLLGPTAEEAKFRASSAAFRANLRRQLSGMAVTMPELRENVEAVPDPERVTAAQFMAALDENLLDIRTKLQKRKAMYNRPAGQLSAPGGTMRYDKNGRRIK